QCLYFKSLIFECKIASRKGFNSCAFTGCMGTYATNNIANKLEFIQIVPRPVLKPRYRHHFKHSSNQRLLICSNALVPLKNGHQALASWRSDEEIKTEGCG